MARTRPSQRSARAASRALVVADLKRQQARAARRGRLIAAGAAVVAVVLVAAVIVVVGLGREPGPGPAEASGPASAETVADVTGVPVATLDAVGVGDDRVPLQPLSGQTPLKARGGLPEVLYVGAEFCPFCAAQRWPLAVALARFGTFTDLQQTTSSSSDEDPNTPTLDFLGASYTSRYLTLSADETEDRARQPLETLSAADEKVFDTFDFPPYQPPPGGSIPFVDVGNAYLASGAAYDPSVLAGLTQDQIASRLADPDSTVAQDVDGAANVFSAAICSITHDEPASVCAAPGVVAARSGLGPS